MESPVAEQIVQLRQRWGSQITKSWSANFEQEPYLDRPDLVLQDSLLAIAATAGQGGPHDPPCRSHRVDECHAPFVNLVTPGELGDPAGYLVGALRERLGESIRLEEIGECGCGGFVVRVWRL